MTTQEPETQSKAQTHAVEWGPEHVDHQRTTIRVNGANPITWSTGTGEGSRELRLEVGFNSVPSALLDRVVTGGVDSRGKPRRAVARPYFERKVEVTTFTAAGKPIKRKMPLVQMAQPSLGDEVHIIRAVKGSRSHYRTKARVRQQAQMSALLEQVQLQGAQMMRQGAQIMQLMEQNSALMAKMLGDGVGPAQPARAEPPFDPGEMTVGDMAARLGPLSEAELELVMIAEMRGERRATAIDAIKRAFAAQDMRKEDDPDEAAEVDEVEDEAAEDEAAETEPRDVAED